MVIVLPLGYIPDFDTDKGIGIALDIGFDNMGFDIELSNQRIDPAEEAEAVAMVATVVSSYNKGFAKSPQGYKSQ